jgi:hypothetical protein
MANAFLWSTWASVPVFVMYLFTLEASEKSALTPIGMMIAALIASASVIKSIQSQKALDVEKARREMYGHYMDLYETMIEFIQELLMLEKIEQNYLSKMRFKTGRVNFFPQEIQVAVKEIFAHAYKLHILRRDIENISRFLEKERPLPVVVSGDATPKEQLRVKERAKENLERLKEKKDIELDKKYELLSESEQWLQQRETSLEDVFRPFLKI